MTQNLETNKFKKTDIIDSIIVVLSIVASTLAFSFGLNLFSFLLLSIAIGYFAKLVALKSYVYAGVTAVVGFGCSVLVSYFLYSGKTLMPSIIASSFIFAGVAFAICVILNKSKSLTCLVVSIVLVLVAVVALVHHYSLSTGTLSFDGFVEYIENIFTTLKNDLISTLEPIQSNYANIDINEEVEQIVLLIKYLAIGIIVMICEFISLLSTVFFNLGIRTSNAHVILPNEWKIKPNKASAAIQFIASLVYFFSVFLGIFGVSSSSLQLYVLNVVLVFTPQLMIYGIVGLLKRKKQNHVGIFSGNIIIIFAGIFMFVLSPIFFVIMCGMWGSIMLVIKSKTEELLKKDEESNYGNSHDDFYDENGDYDDYDNRNYDDYDNRKYDDYDNRENDYDNKKNNDDKYDDYS